MVPAVLDIKFGDHDVPLRGFECPICGRSAAWAEDVSTAQAYARRVGLRPSAVRKPATA
jgi:hypothetical protein